MSRQIFNPIWPQQKSLQFYNKKLASVRQADVPTNF